MTKVNGSVNGSSEIAKIYGLPAVAEVGQIAIKAIREEAELYKRIGKVALAAARVGFGFSLWAAIAFFRAVVAVAWFAFRLWEVYQGEQDGEAVLRLYRAAAKKALARAKDKAVALFQEYRPVVEAWVREQIQTAKLAWYIYQRAQETANA